MRRSLFVTGIAAVFLLPSASTGPAATARVAGSETISLQRGQGYAVIASRGAVIGTVAHGWVRVVDLPGGGAPHGYVRGCEARAGRLSGRLYCRGRDLRLFVYDGTWRVRVAGRGINVSGRIRGSLGLDRAEGGTGVYSIAGARYRRWPAELRFFSVRS